MYTVNSSRIGGICSTSVQMEPTTGIEPVNLVLTKDALYRLSYVGGLPIRFAILSYQIGAA